MKDNKNTLRKFLLYLLKFEMGTIVLAPTVYFLSDLGPVLSVIIGNFIGACVFFPIDSKIFSIGNKRKKRKTRKFRRKNK